MADSWTLTRTTTGSLNKLTTSANEPLELWHEIGHILGLFMRLATLAE